MNLNYQQICDDLQSKYHTNIPIDITRKQIEEAMDAFFKFLDEPDEIKTRIDFTIAKEHRRGGVGFRHRDPKDDMYNDSKDFFHYHPEIFNRYSEFLEQNPVVMNFMKHAEPIWNHVRDVIQEMMKMFDNEFPGTYDKIFDTDIPHIQLRFLKYNWQQSGQYLAKPHFDAGSFTLALGESCDGLRIGSGPGDLAEIVHKEQNAVFMFSSNFKKIIDSDKFKPGWHDVIQLDEKLVGKQFARWAMVVFIDAKGVEALSKTETHKFYVPEKAG